MEDNNHIDDIFKSALDDLKMEPSEKSWENISGKLSAKRSFRLKKRAGLWFSAATLLLIFSYSAYKLTNKPANSPVPVPQIETTQVVQNNINDQSVQSPASENAQPSSQNNVSVPTIENNNSTTQSSVSPSLTESDVTVNNSQKPAAQVVSGNQNVTTPSSPSPSSPSPSVKSKSTVPAETVIWTSVPRTSNQVSANNSSVNNNTAPASNTTSANNNTVTSTNTTTESSVNTSTQETVVENPTNEPDNTVVKDKSSANVVVPAAATVAVGAGVSRNQSPSSSGSTPNTTNSSSSNSSSSNSTSDNSISSENPTSAQAEPASNAPASSETNTPSTTSTTEPNPTAEQIAATTAVSNDSTKLNDFAPAQNPQASSSLLKKIISHISAEVYYTPELTQTTMKVNEDYNGPASKNLDDYTNEKSQYSYSTGMNLKYDIGKKWSVLSGVAFSNYAKSAVYNTMSVVADSVFQDVYVNGSGSHHHSHGHDNNGGWGHGGGGGGGQGGHGGGGHGHPDPDHPDDTLSNHHYIVHTPCGSFDLQNIPEDIANGSSTSDTLNVKTEVSQEVHFISIPLLVRYTFGSNKLKYFVEAGGAINFVNKDEVVIVVNDATSENGNLNSLSSTNYTLLFGVGANYNFYKGLGMFLKPSLRYSVTPVNIESPVKSYPYYLGLSAGFTIHF